MKSNWKKCKISDICSINQETYSLSEQWKYVNYLDTGSITLNKIENIQYIDLIVDKLPSRARRKVKNGDILYSTVRPNQLHYGQINNQPVNFLVSTGFAVLSVNKLMADSRFIYYILTESSNTETLQAIAEQSVSTYPSIKPSDLGNIEIVLPPLSTQHQIAKILSSLDDKIELNNRINKNLEEQAMAIYKSWFVDFEPFGGKMPKDWRKASVSEIIELHDSKRVPLSSRERSELKKIYPYYGATSVMDYIDKYIFDGIHLLLGEDGTVVDEKGYPILQYVNGKFWVNNHAHVITGKNGYSVELLYLLFKLTNIQSIVTGAVQQKISQSGLFKIITTIPSKNILKKIDDIIQPIFAKMRNIKDENSHLSSLRDTLLPKLMNGEIDVSKIRIEGLYK